MTYIECPIPDSVEKLILMAERYCGKSISRDMVTPIARGASGRTIIRLILPQGNSLIGVHWTAERDDNDSFVPVATMLYEGGIRVPRILYYMPETEGEGYALVSDLGDRDLLSYATQDWRVRKLLYISAMEELHKLHEIRIPCSIKLQAPFDKKLYLWEQEYFAEHFIQNTLGISGSDFLSHPEMGLLAEQLSKLPKFPLHRDFQSQNIHILNESAWIIDFQGMRLGLPEYDLASLIYDPYTLLSTAEQEELISEWELICQRKLDRKVFKSCAIQRMLQASGAFAKLSAMGNSWYQKHLPTSLRTLRKLTKSTSVEKLFEQLLNKASSLLC